MAERRQQGRRERDATTDTQGREPSPGADALLDGLGVPDQAYKLHLRNMSYRAIGARLGIDKTTAQRYVKQLERETAPRRKEAREKLLRGTIERLRGIAVEAADQLDETDARDARGAAALLNTRLACEREIARLQGLYEHLVTDDDLGGITITISRRRDAGPADGPLSASGDASEGDE